MRRLIGAIQFLTILPLRVQGAPPGRAALFFPLIGAGLGWLAAQWLRMLEPWLGSSLAALLVLGAIALLTGGLHEDGLADVADAFRAQRSKDRMLAILKDSRIGSYGAVALVFVIAIRWQALVRMPALPTGELAACFALSRAAMVAMAFFTRPVGDGLGAAFSAALTTATAVGAIAQGLVFAFLPGVYAALALIAVAALFLWLLREWFDIRIGGVNGDCLGATCLIVETFLMVTVSCRNCFW